MNKRIVALDVGDRRIGIAVSDALGFRALLSLLFRALSDTGREAGTTLSLLFASSW